MRVVSRFTACVALCIFGVARADVRLPKIFADHMVLQQELPIAVFGWADPGEEVSVSFHGKVASTATGKDGRWRVTLPPLKADGTPHALVVKGRTTITIEDVLLGEVWLASGQSNMTRGLRYVKGRVKKEPMDFPQYRLFAVIGRLIPQRDDILGGWGWAPATHKSMTSLFVHPRVGPYEYSEVTYYFGKTLHERLKIPVGMITTAWGGTTAKEWTPVKDPEKRFDFALGKPQRGQGALYQSMLHGIPPFTIRGVLWYQGENDGRNRNYASDLEAMIQAWRGKFERPDMPFYMAQIAQTTYASGMLGVWEAEAWVMSHVPHTGLAPSNDLWDQGAPSRLRADKHTGWPIAGGGNPHPPNKHIMAHRLAHIALARAYGKVDREVFGPMYAAHHVNGGRIIVKFRHAGAGLKTDDGQSPNWFEISGGAKQRGRLKYVKARARIVGKDAVEVWAPQVKAPRHVRFAWHPLARHNLYNPQGLPAVSFRSDGLPAMWNRR